MNGTAIVGHGMVIPNVHLFWPKKLKIVNRGIVVHELPTGGARVKCCTIRKTSKKEVEEWFSDHLDY